MFVAFHALSSIYLQKSARVIGSNIMALVIIDKHIFVLKGTNIEETKRQTADLTEY